MRRAQRSVSYTHLDVYKRQVFWRKRDGNSDGAAAASHYVQRRGGALPVSYTHLDVYQRQDVPLPAGVLKGYGQP